MRRAGLIDLRPLRSSAPFRRLWLSGLLQVVAAQTVIVAVLVQVWELTASTVWTGTIGLVNAVPMIVFGIVGGSLADAMDRRLLVQLTTIGQALAGLGLAWQAMAGLESLPIVLALVAAQATANALGAPARRTFVPRLLPSGQIGGGLALHHLGAQAAMLVGPALGGLIIGVWGTTGCYIGYAGATVLAMYGIIRLPRMPPIGEIGRAGVRSIVDGVRYVLSKPVLRGSFASDLAATLMAMPVALFPLVNEVRFDGDPRTLGLFLSSIAVGGIVAGLASGTVTRADRPGPIQLWAAAVWGAALAVFALVGPPWLALLMLALAGAADTVAVLARGLMVQLATPDNHRGRVSACDHVIGVAGPDVGNFRAGMVAGVTSAPFALASGGLACVALIGLTAWRNPALRSFRVSEDAVTEDVPAS